MRITRGGTKIGLVVNNGTPTRVRIVHAGTREVASEVEEFSFAITITGAEPLTAAELARVEEIALHNGHVVTMVDPTKATARCAANMPILVERSIRHQLWLATRVVVAERN